MTKEHKRKIGIKNTKHGFRKIGNNKQLRFYRIWAGMLQRCTDIYATSYSFYGKIGINVNKRWNKFENFRDDMYESYKVHVKKFGEVQTSLDRINNNGNYSEENCRWATMKEQCRNTRRNRLLTFNKETYCVSEWAEILGFKADTLLMRLKRNWSIEKTLTTPLQCN